jgi:hypothetical protein
VTGLAISTGNDATYIGGDLLDDANVRAALSALDGPKGPPVVIHRAKELMHGLRLSFPTLERDTAVMAYLLDPGEGKYLLEDLALRYLSLELRSPDQVEGTLDFDGDANARDTGRRVAVLVRLADALAEALDARELVALYDTIERPLVAVLAKMEAAGVRTGEAPLVAGMPPIMTTPPTDAVVAVHLFTGTRISLKMTTQIAAYPKMRIAPIMPPVVAAHAQVRSDEFPAVRLFRPCQRSMRPLTAPSRGQVDRPWPRSRGTAKARPGCPG